MKMIMTENAAAKGIAMGKVFLFQQETIIADTRRISETEQENALQRYQKAVSEVCAELEPLAKHSDIFAAHIALAQDMMLQESVFTKIQSECKNTELALEESISELVQMFAEMDDVYLKERADDIKDIGKRLLYALKGIKTNPFTDLQEDTIVVAKDLTPSDTANMDFQYIKGFVTETGGMTSHVCIMARSMEIPAFVGVADIQSQVQNGDEIILDTIEQKIICNPDAKTKMAYQQKAKTYHDQKAKLQAYKNLPAKTKDGKIVELFANVGSIADVENACQKGAEGIGLFRSEFLYMENQHFPTEEEQFLAYKKAVELMQRPIIIRTLDIGGDKALSYHTFEKEENPFLGWRAIRISLEMKQMFQTQLRALLRASAYGDIRIMYPMIISVDEFLEANAVLEECKKQLQQEGIAFDENIQTGIMVETPAAVLCAEDLAQVVDFFSIGTNDLTQYILAVDRGNEKIKHLYNTFHPAVLRAIRTVIQAGKKYGKLVGMCGEFASDEKAVPILLGMGLDEFSMVAAEIVNVKYQICHLDYAQCCVIAEEVCKKHAVAEVQQYLENIIP